MGGVLRREHAAGSSLRPGSLITFSDAGVTNEQLTGNVGLLAHALDRIRPGGHTALYDAVAEGAASLAGVEGRKAVVVLTDGIANRGSMDIDQAIASAVRDSVSVTVIGLGSDVRTPRLERVPAETGGTYFFTPGPDGLRSIYETISSRSRNEYVITFRTEQRGEYLRNVTVRLNRRREASRAYFQPGSSLFGSGSKDETFVGLYGIAVLAIISQVSFKERTLQSKEDL